jgi:VanZ family protein
VSSADAAASLTTSAREVRFVSRTDEPGSGSDLGETTVPSRRRWLAVAGLVTLCILVASLLPPGLLLGPAPEASPDPRGPLGLVDRDKWLHALGYAILAGTLVPAVADQPGRNAVDRTLVVAVAVAVGVGLGVELLQWPHPARTASFADATANLVGAVAGAAAALVGRRRSRPG